MKARVEEGQSSVAGNGELHLIVERVNADLRGIQFIFANHFDWYRIEDKRPSGSKITGRRDEPATFFLIVRSKALYTFEKAPLQQIVIRTDHQTICRKKLTRPSFRGV